MFGGQPSSYQAQGEEQGEGVGKKDGGLIMNRWLMMERFVYFEVTPEEREMIYGWAEKDFSTLLDIIYIMRKHAKEEVMGDSKALLDFRKTNPDKETFEA